MNRLRMVAFAAAALFAAGCGDGPKVVPVSGVVTVDGKPYPNAVVAFQPMGGGATDSPGLGSTALTDERGRYTLYTIDGKAGAVAGKHKVRIQTKREAGATVVDPSVGSADSLTPEEAKRVKSQVEPIPTEWYGSDGGKEFTVPEGGTDNADFAIEGVKPKKK